MNIKFDYRGKNVIVTGSAKGIGKEIAMAYAKAGAQVIVADISEKDGTDTVKEICAMGGTADFVRTDVTEEQSVIALVDAALRLYGRVDIMVNNAGVVGNIKGDPLTALDSSDWDRSYQINLRGVFYCCKAIYPTFAGQGYGNILNTASVAGKTGAPEIAEYSAMKLPMSSIFSRSSFIRRFAVFCCSYHVVFSQSARSSLDRKSGTSQMLFDAPLGRVGNQYTSVGKSFIKPSEDRCGPQFRLCIRCECIEINQVKGSVKSTIFQ